MFEKVKEFVMENKKEIIIIGGSIVLGYFVGSRIGAWKTEKSIIKCVEKFGPGSVVKFASSSPIGKPTDTFFAISPDIAKVLAG